MKFLQNYFFIADSIPIDVWNAPFNVKIQNSTFLNFICRQACHLGEIHPRIIQIRGYEKCLGKWGNFREIERKLPKSANFMKTKKN